MASSASLAAGTTLGRYSIVRLLGEGGMGSVYEAKHEDLGKRVAIKTLHAQYAASAQVRARFLREGQASSRIRHPHVVDVYDVVSEGERPYLVMEFLEGEDLGRLLGREGALSCTQAADLLVPAVAAVAAAHDLNVVHRDLKPENIFLCNERGAIKPKVVDFGISKIVDQEEGHALTGTAAFLGTPYYMAPEQAQGAKNIDARVDQYSFGVILYQCVVGKRPFDDPTLFTLMNKIVSGDFPPPRQANPEVPEAFEALILRAMARTPDQRFGSTRSFGRALLEFASERTRTLHGHEFENHEAPAPPAVSTPHVVSSGGAVSATATTFGHSSHPYAPVRSGRPALALPAGILVTLLIGGGLWLALDRGRGAGPETSGPAAVTPSTPATTAPPPLASPSLPAPASSPPITVPSAEPQPDPKQASSVKGTAPRPSPAAPRPKLAPR